VKLNTGVASGGYEPTSYSDRFGNIYVSAHKTYQGDAFTADPTSPTQGRAASFLWTSTDGVHFTSLAGRTPLAEQNLNFGDEGDMAFDQSDHGYFTDLNVASSTFTRYAIRGLGKAASVYSSPVTPVAFASADRPFIAAHGNGTVVITVRGAGQSALARNTGGNSFGDGSGTLAVAVSHDGGATFPLHPYTIAGANSCRPTADPRPGSRNLYLLCSDGAKHVFAAVSTDDGRTWNNSTLGEFGDRWITAGNAAQPDFISTAVDHAGVVWALYDQLAFGPTNADITQTTRVAGLANNGLEPYMPVRGRLLLSYSADKGKTWHTSDVTPAGGGIYEQASLAVAPTGLLGIQSYFRPNTRSAWSLRAGTLRPGQILTMVNPAPSLVIAPSSSTSCPGDFTQASFGPGNALDVVANVQTVADPVTTDTLGKVSSADVYFIQSLPNNRG
jgi:hypothetical protein